MNTNEKKAAVALTQPPPGMAHLDPEPAPLPDRLREPELSAFRAVHTRIVAAHLEQVEADRDWLLLQPILAHHYQLGERDQIDADGRILRHEPDGEETP